MGLLSWVWPPALAIVAMWMVVQVRASCAVEDGGSSPR